MADSEHARIAQGKHSLLPHMVDRLAAGLPDAVYGEWPVLPTSYDAGFRAVTYAELANVVNGLAWWLVEQLGPPSRTGEVLAFMGANDVRLTALLLAAVKTGYVVLFTSPRNSGAGHQALFERLECRVLVTSDPVPAPAVLVLELIKPQHLLLPGVDDLLGKVHQKYSYDKTYEEGRWDPCLIIHTSGSTGLPKPIIWTHESVARQQNMAALPGPDDGTPSLYGQYIGKRLLNAMPPFHGAGVGQYIFYGIPFGSVAIAPATATIATAEGVVEALKRTPFDIALMPPSIVAELAQRPDLLDYCAERLEMIVYIGGDLPQALGDRVAAKVPLRCQWGASEVGIPAQVLPADLSGLSDWHYVRFHPSCGLAFEEVTEGISELVLKRDESLAATQVSFSVGGWANLEEYRTKDLFKRHSVVPDAWCWTARGDDLIVFSNGEKTNPISMEQYIEAHAPGKGALVIGTQRFQAALLIEPANVDRALSTVEKAALIEQVWPFVEKANQVAPAHARVEKSLILVATPDRPFVRTPKGTIQRALSIAQYSADIDRLYNAADVILEDDSDDDGSEAAFNPADADAVAHFIRRSISTITHWADLADTDNFFERGMDSLQVLQLTRALRRRLYRPHLGMPTVYHNATVPQLTAAVMSSPQRPNGGPRADPDREIMAPLLSTYRALIRQLPSPTTTTPPTPLDTTKPIDIILTGSTGALGTLLLHSLLRHPATKIRHIFCLNRSADGGRSHITGGAAADPQRVTFLRADLARPRLGLAEDVYTALLRRKDKDEDEAGASGGLVLLHNAWPVNFNWALPAFRPQLAGVVNLFALAAAAAAAASKDRDGGKGGSSVRVVFVSSVGAVGGRAGAAAAAEEVLLPDDEFDAPFANGYARSKFLAELLCDAAARQLGVGVDVLRVGQMAGSVGDGEGRGMSWNRNEWFPSLVVSSLLRLGCLPDSLGPLFSEVDWLPGDLLADVVCELALREEKQSGSGGGAEVFHLRNPHTISWSMLLPAVVDAARARFAGQASPEVTVVAPSVWLARLQETAEKNTAADSASTSNSALKLIDFYRHGLFSSRDNRAVRTAAHMSITRALAASPSLRDIPAVQPEWMRKWVGEWLGSVKAEAS